MSDGENIGFQDPDEDEMPSEMKDHMLAAFRHEAGLGPHPGPYTGPPRRKRDPDQPTETDMQRAAEESDERPHEAGYKKMKAAQRGGLGPSEMEQAAAKQQSAIQQTAGTTGQVQATKAQAAQVGPAPPPAPGGPEGVSEPYPAERGQTPPGIPEQ